MIVQIPIYYPTSSNDHSNRSKFLNSTLRNINNNGRLKFLSLNCCSLHSTGKRASFLSLIDEHNPDIICGCESHLDESYHTAEIFPNEYAVLRKDRAEGASAVFICIKKSLNVSEESDLNTDTELIWAKIILLKKNPMYICSFYRPPNATIDSILQLQISLNKLLRCSTYLLNIIMVGDFNLPSIAWIDGYGLINLTPTCGTEVNDLFLDMINDVCF